MNNPLAPLPSTERFSASPTNYRASTLPVAPADNQPEQEEIPLPPPPAPPTTQQEPANVTLNPMTLRNTGAQMQLNPATIRDVEAPQEQPQGVTLNPESVRPARNFRNIYEDLELGGVAQEFYRQRDGLQLSPREAVAKFVEDRTWRQGNTVSAIRDWAGRRFQMDEPQQQRLGYLKDYWDTLPNVFSEGGRGLPGVAVNLVAGAIDPVNVVGPLLGRGLGALGRIGVTAATDAAATAGVNVLEQSTDIGLGRREGYSPTEAGLAGAVGAVASLGGNALAAGASRYMRSSTGEAHLDAQRDAKIGAPPEEVAPLRERMETAIERGAAELFDRFAPLERVQRAARGIGTSPRELRDAYANLNPDDLDPIAGSHYQARMLAGSSGRVDDFLQRGGVLPPDTLNPTIRQNTFETDVSPSVFAVYEPFNRTGQVENFNMYLMATRARYIRDVANPTIMREAQATERATGIRRGETPAQFQERINAAGEKVRKKTLFEDSQAFLDSGVARTPQEAQLFASRAIDDWIAYGDARPDFVNGKAQYKKLIETPLEYQRRSGVISADDVANMTGAQYHNPNNVEFLYTPFLPTESTIGAIRGGKVILGSAPGRAKMKGGTGNRMDVEEATVSYIFRAVNASDRNRMKVAFYNDLDAAIKNGSIGNDEVAVKVKFDPQELMQRFYSDPEADAMLRRAGIQTDKTNTPPDEILRVMVLNDWKGGGKDNIDIVFRDGKVETWRILDNDVLSALKPYQDDVGGVVGKALEFSNAFARYRSAVIMANPVTMIKNAIRDTTAAGISSPLGFVPVVTTAKGMAGVFKSPLLRMLQALSDKTPGNPGSAFIRRELAAGDAYRRAWASGMGYSGQIKNNMARGRLELTQHHKAGSPAEKFYQNALHYMQSNVFSRGLSGWLEFSNSVEMASRMGEFYLAKQFGMSDVAAAYLGREVATDFGQRGRNTTLRVLMNATSFLNAGMQSVAKLGRLARTHPGKLMAGMAAYAVYDAATHAINSGHPSYQDQPEVVRAQNVLMPIYVNNEEAMRWLSGEQTEFTWQSDIDQGNPQIRNAPEVRIYIPVPKPFEFGTLGTLINGMMDTISTGNGNNIRDAFVTSLTAAIPNAHMPDIVQPFWDLWRNKDGLGRTIVPGAMNRPDVPGLAQYTERTPEWARAASESLANVVNLIQAEGAERRTLLTPIEVEYLANFVMPGLLNVPLQALTEMTHDRAKTGERATARSDEADVMRDPASLVTRGLQLAATSRSSPALQQLYEIKARADALTGIERADTTDLFRVLDYDPNNMSQERLQAMPMSQTLRATLDGIRALTIEAQAISTSTELTAEEKRLRLDGNLQTRNDLARNTLSLIRQSNMGDRLLAGFFNDPRNDSPQQNIIRQTIQNFRRD